MSKIYRTELRIENGTHEWRFKEFEATEHSEFMSIDNQYDVRPRIIMREIIDFVFVCNKEFGSTTFECWHLDKDTAMTLIMAKFTDWKKDALQICNEIQSCIASVTAEWENIKLSNQPQP